MYVFTGKCSIRIDIIIDALAIVTAAIAVIIVIHIIISPRIYTMLLVHLKQVVYIMINSCSYYLIIIKKEFYNERREKGSGCKAESKKEDENYD